MGISERNHEMNHNRNHSKNPGEVPEGITGEIHERVQEEFGGEFLKKRSKRTVENLCGNTGRISEKKAEKINVAIPGGFVQQAWKNLNQNFGEALGKTLEETLMLSGE